MPVTSVTEQYDFTSPKNQGSKRYNFPNELPNPRVFLHRRDSEPSSSMSLRNGMHTFEADNKGSNFVSLSFSVSWLLLEFPFCFHYNCWQFLKRKTLEKKKKDHKDESQGADTLEMVAGHILALNFLFRFLVWKSLYSVYF